MHGYNRAHCCDSARSLPTTFVIDKNGNIIKRYVGEPEFPVLHQLLQKALAG